MFVCPQWLPTARITKYKENEIEVVVTKAYCMKKQNKLYVTKKDLPVFNLSNGRKKNYQLRVILLCGNSVSVSMHNNRLGRVP